MVLPAKKMATAVRIMNPMRNETDVWKMAVKGIKKDYKSTRCSMEPSNCESLCATQHLHSSFSISYKISHKVFFTEFVAGEMVLEDVIWFSIRQFHFVRRANSLKKYIFLKNLQLRFTVYATISANNNTIHQHRHRTRATTTLSPSAPQPQPQQQQQQQHQLPQHLLERRHFVQQKYPHGLRSTLMLDRQMVPSSVLNQPVLLKVTTAYGVYVKNISVRIVASTTGKREENSWEGGGRGVREEDKEEGEKEGAFVVCNHKKKGAGGAY